jgi:sensor histidine kinase YesM
MYIIKLSRKEILRHLLIWVLLTAFFCLIDPVPGNIIVQTAGTFLIILDYMVVYYGHYLFAFPFFYKKHILKLILSSALVFIIFAIINYFNFFYIMTIYGDKPAFKSNMDWGFTIFILYSIISMTAFGFYRNKISILHIQSQSEREKALLIKELGFLKNQFNSHITFNFLNYCYSHLFRSSKEAAAAIESYSEMLRFTMNSSPNEMVLLEKELIYIEQFINLKKQLNKGICVQFTLEGSLTNKFILPRIFITFVENAFKHGESHSIENPIVINVKSNTTNIVLEVKNKKSQAKIKPISTGIGQQNMKKQLELFYKSKYQLSIIEKEDFYFCKLELNN